MFPLFSHPKCKALDIYGIIKDVIDVNNDSKARLNSATQAHKELVSACSTSKPTNTGIIHAIDAMLPHIHTLSLEMSRLAEDKPYQIKKLVPEWRSPSRAGKDMFKFNGFNYELVMLLTSKASCLLNEAGQNYYNIILTEQPDTRSTLQTATEHCRIAAGLFRYVQEHLLPHWSDDEIPKDAHPEMHSEYLDVAQAYAIGCARMFASSLLIRSRREIINKYEADESLGITAEVTPEDRNKLKVKAECIAGLCREASDKIKGAATLLTDSPVGKLVDKAILRGMDVMVHILQVRERRHLGEAKYYAPETDEGARGAAVGYMQLALGMKRDYPSVKGLDAQAVRLVNAIRSTEMAEISRRCEMFTQYNNMISNEAVPEPSLLEGAQPLSRISAVEYEPPAALFDGLTLKSKKTLNVQK